MSSTPTIRITGPESLLSALPHMLGYQPADSVLGIALHDSRVGMVERIDTPPIDQIEDMLAATIPPMLRQRPTAVLVIGYEMVTGEAVEAVEAFASALAASGLDVPAPVLVTPTGWRHLDCTCCPPGGNPLPAAEHPVGLEMSAVTGSAPAPSRADLAQRLTPTKHAEAVGAECERITAEQAEDVQASALAWSRVVTSGTAVTDLPAHVLALAAVSLTRNTSTEFRDALLCHLCPGTMPSDLLDQHTVQAIRDNLPLDPDQHPTATLDRLIQTAASLPDTHAVPVLTVVANYAWWRGDGTLARLALDRALGIDPHYRLAALLSRVVDLGIQLTR